MTRLVLTLFFWAGHQGAGDQETSYQDRLLQAGKRKFQCWRASNFISRQTAAEIIDYYLYWPFGLFVIFCPVIFAPHSRLCIILSFQKIWKSLATMQLWMVSELSVWVNNSIQEYFFFSLPRQSLLRWRRETLSLAMDSTPPLDWPWTPPSCPPRPLEGGDGASRPDGARPSSRVRGGRRGGGKFIFYSMRMDETNIWFVPCLISSDYFKTLESVTTL